MSVIQDNLRSNNLKRWWRFVDGHLLDVSGNGTKGVAAGALKFNRDGILLDGVADYVEFDDLDLTSNMTIIARLHPAEVDHAGGSDAPLIVTKLNAFSFYITNLKKLGVITEGVSDTTQVSSGSIDITKESVVAITYNANVGERKLFIDGSLDSTESSLTGDIDSNTNHLFVGADGLDYFNKGTIAEILVFDATLSETEITEITNELNDLPSDTNNLLKSVQESYYDADDPALVCALTFDKTTGVIPDETINANDATITGEAIVVDYDIGPASRFISNANYAEIIRPNAPLAEITQGPSMAYSAWYKPFGFKNIQTIVSQQNGTGIGRSWMAFFTGVGRVINTNLGGSTLETDINAELGQWYHVVINYLAKAPSDPYGKLQIWVNGELNVEQIKDIDEGADGDINLFVGKTFGNGTAGYNHEHLIYTRGLLPFEIEALYNKGVVQFQGGFGVKETDAISTGFIDNSPFQVNGGSFKLNSEVIDGNIVKTIECVTDGNIYADINDLNISFEEVSYGTWEWWMLKGADANVTSFQFTGDILGAPVTAGQDGYLLEISNTEAVALKQSTSGSISTLFETSGAYVANDTWYGFKVTRGPTGEFNGYIRGGSFGHDFTQIIPSSGTNPTTENTTQTGKYIIANMMAGDKLVFGCRNSRYSMYKNLFVK